MPREVTRRPAGLWTDPSPYSAAPEGAMRVATNVVIRRPGFVEPRPGLGTDEIGAWAKPAGYDLRRLIAYGGEMLAWSHDADQWRIDVIGGAQITGNAAPPDEERIEVQAVEARGSLYFTTSDGIRKITSSADTASELAGLVVLPVALERINASTGNVLPTGNQLAYRVVVRSRDANGYERVGPPSPRAIVTGPPSGTSNVRLQVPIPPRVVAGDFLDVYRSELSGGRDTAPSDDLYLAASYEVQAADITAGYVTIDDKRGQTQYGLGEALYTNEAQAGIAQANLAPPKAQCLASFKGSMFFGGLTGLPTILARLVDVGGYVIASNNTNQRTTTGLQAIQQAGDTTAGVNTISNVSSVTGIVAGMVVSTTNFADPFGSAGVFPADTRVLSITGSGPYTITLDDNALSSNTGLAFHFWDVVTIDGVAFAGSYLGTSADGRVFAVSGNEHGQTRIAETARELAYVASRYFNAQPTKIRVLADTAEENGASLTIVHPDPDPAQSVTLDSSRTAAFDPVLPVTSKTDELAGAITWSRYELPEAVPAVHTTVVGDSKKRVLALVPAANTLWIFKEDGLWGLTGTSADVGWQIDEVDKSIRLVKPEAVAELRGVCYAWTSRGVIAISGSGITEISRLPLESTLEPTQSALLAAPDNARGTWLVTHPAHQEICVGVPGGPGEVDSESIYVFNTKTGAWTKWSVEACTAAINPATGELWLGTTNYVVVSERAETADATHAITIASADAATGVITINGGSAWLPVIGDAIRQGLATAILTAVASSTSFTVDSATGLAPGAANAWEAFECSIGMIAKTAKDPMSLKLWTEWQWLAAAFEGVARAEFVATSDRSSAEASISIVTDRSLSTLPMPIRGTMPRAHCLACVVFPELRIAQALSGWVIAGLQLEFEPISTLTRQRYA